MESHGPTSLSLRGLLLFSILLLLLGVCAAHEDHRHHPHPKYGTGNLDFGPGSDTHVHCPVCGTPVSFFERHNYIDVKNGTQFVYACSPGHAQALYDYPMRFATQTAPSDNIVVPEAGYTVISDAECPFCLRPAVREHALPFQHGQAIYSCDQDAHYASLFDEPKLRSTFKLVKQTNDRPHCPVCGEKVSSHHMGNYIEAVGTNQRVHACSPMHAQMIYDKPFAHVYRNKPLDLEDPVVGYSAITNATCMFCDMDAVQEHALPFRHGQLLYTCSMNDHYDLLFNESALRSHFKLVKEQPPDIHCPVCDKKVKNLTNFVGVGNGAAQKIFACSADHAQRIFEKPLNYVLRYFPENILTPVDGWTPVINATRCPYSDRPAVYEHALQFKHGQVLYSSDRKRDYEDLFDESKLREVFSLVKEEEKLHCPVCGDHIHHDELDNYVDINNGEQRIYACSPAHAIKIFDDPMHYAQRPWYLNVPPPVSGWTKVPGPVKCPFCSMDAVEEHSLPFDNGQSLYACSMKDHYAKLYDQPNLKTLFTLVTNVTKRHFDCPVCNHPVMEKTNYIDINSGSQKIYAHSAEHAQKLFDAPLKYAQRTTPLTVKEPAEGWTTVPGTRCPFCSMDGVLEHSLPLFHDQTVYACNMDEHYKNLFNETKLRSTFTLVQEDHGHLHCPICGDKVFDQLNLVSINEGAQSIYFQSSEHAQIFMANPLHYFKRLQPLDVQEPVQGWTPINNAGCPFCNRIAVEEHALPLEHGQAIHSCELDEHYRKLYDFKALLDTFSIQVSYCGDGTIHTDRGEQCEPPGEGCCDDYCHFQQPGMVCRDPPSECFLPAYCSGQAAECPANRKVYVGTSCNRQAWGPGVFYRCDAAGQCSQTTQ